MGDCDDDGRCRLKHQPTGTPLSSDEQGSKSSSDGSISLCRTNSLLALDYTACTDVTN